MVPLHPLTATQAKPPIYWKALSDAEVSDNKAKREQQWPSSRIESACAARVASSRIGRPKEAPVAEASAVEQQAAEVPVAPTADAPAE